MKRDFVLFILYVVVGMINGLVAYFLTGLITNAPMEGFKTTVLILSLGVCVIFIIVFGLAAILTIGRMMRNWLTVMEERKAVTYSTGTLPNVVFVPEEGLRFTGFDTVEIPGGYLVYRFVVEDIWSRNLYNLTIEVNKISGKIVSCTGIVGAMDKTIEPNIRYIIIKRSEGVFGLI